VPPVATVAVVLVALNLRAVLGVIQALVGDIARDLSVGPTGLGLLTAVIVLALGAAAPLAQVLAAQFGPESATLAALGLLCAGMLLEVLDGGLWLYLLGAVVLGAGMGIGSVIAPTLVIKYVRTWRGLALGLYSLSMGLGLLIAVTSAPLLAQTLGGWRSAIMVWCGVSAACASLWFPVTLWLRRTTPGALPSTTDLTGGMAPLSAVDSQVPTRGLPWRHPAAWLVTAFGASAMTMGFAITGWIVPFEVSLGMSSAQAVNHLALAQGFALFSMLLAPVVADRLPGPRWPVGLVLATLAGSIGMFLWAPPELGSLAAAICGVGIGGSNAVVLTLVAGATDDHAGASRLNAMVVLVSYPLAAASPVIVGFVADISGSIGLGLALVCVPALACLCQLPRFRRETLRIPGEMHSATPVE
jgi:CP family cyanate transporter-like MFS transporter